MQASGAGFQLESDVYTCYTPPSGLGFVWARVLRSEVQLRVQQWWKEGDRHGVLNPSQALA